MLCQASRLALVAFSLFFLDRGSADSAELEVVAAESPLARERCSFLQVSQRLASRSHSTQMATGQAVGVEVSHQKRYQGQCLVQTGKKPSVKYAPEAMQEGVGSDSLRPTKMLEFSGAPELGLYNPSIVELPESFLQKQKYFHSVKFAMTIRQDLHQCGRCLKESTQQMPASENNIAGTFLLLDAHMCVVDEGPMILGGSSVERLAQDVRLYVNKGELQASFVMWQFGPTSIQGRGLWLAPVSINTDSFAGVMDSSRAVRLGVREEKNFGLFQDGGRTMALTWLDLGTKRPPPLTILVPESFTQISSVFKDPNLKAHTWHNSANLLKLDGSGEFLGLMHMHMDWKANSNFMFGHDYRQKFFRLSAKSPSDYVITATSPEFCIQDTAGKCESVQNVMSMIQTSGDELMLSYGINDCEPRLAVFSLSSIFQQISSSESSNTTVQVMQIPEHKPWLTEFAEVLSPSPLWPYSSEGAKEISYSNGLKLHRSLQDAHDLYDSCKTVAGPYGDWPICKDWIPSPCVVYDFGIANEWEFSDSMADQHGCRVHSFDPSDGHVQQHWAHQHENVTFHFLGLSGESQISNGNSWTDSLHQYGSVIGPLKRLDVIKASLGHGAIDVLKIDCEGCEWAALAAVVEHAPEALACVRVLLLELHFAKRFQGSNNSLEQAGELYHHLRSTGWKTFFSVQRGWGPDEKEQELLSWLQAGGDSCCYNVGFVNPMFDESRCPSPQATVLASAAQRESSEATVTASADQQLHSHS